MIQFYTYMFTINNAKITSKWDTTRKLLMIYKKYKRISLILLSPHFHSIPNSFLNHGYCCGHSKHVCKYLYELSTLLCNLQLFGKSQATSNGSKCRFVHCHGANFSILFRDVGLRIHSTIWWLVTKNTSSCRSTSSMNF